MRRQTATALGMVLVAAIFAAGIGAGIAIDRAWLRDARSTETPASVGRVELPRRLARFARKLDLSADQREQIRAILETTRSRIGAETERAQQQILDVLTPEQGVRYLEIVERRKHRRGRRHRR